jgi:hypothetical protein
MDIVFSRETLLLGVGEDLLGVHATSLTSFAGSKNSRSSSVAVCYHPP